MVAFGVYSRSYSRNTDPIAGVDHNEWKRQRHRHRDKAITLNSSNVFEGRGICYME